MDVRDRTDNTIGVGLSIGLGLGGIVAAITHDLSRWLFYGALLGALVALGFRIGYAREGAPPRVPVWLSLVALGLLIAGIISIALLLFG